VSLRAVALALGLLAAQVALSLALLPWRPPAEPVPPPPAAEYLALLTLGDAQAAYRLGALSVQNFGDTGGRTPPLAEYDYGRLVAWFDTLIRLDPDAWHVPVLAAAYYSQTPVAADARLVIAWLHRHALAQPAARWRLLAQAVHLARHQLADPALALTLARDLAALDVVAMPIWTRQLPAQIMAEMGDPEGARREIEAVEQRFPDLSDAERNYHRDFLDRLGAGK
jgi:hypothetical protein